MSKILIMTNHSYMLYRFRLELIQEMRKAHEVVLSMPFVGHEEEFSGIGNPVHPDGGGPPGDEPQNRFSPVPDISGAAEGGAAGYGHHLFH